MIAYAFCGSFCTLRRSLAVMKKLKESGEEILPIMSEIVYHTDTRFGRAEAFREEVLGICGREIIHSVRDAEPIGPVLRPEILIVAPCTGNTLAKLAHGITDTAVTMAIKSQLRADGKVLLALASNGAIFTSLNKDMLDTVKQRLSTENAVYLPNGVDISAIRAQKRDKAELLAELSLPEDSFIVGHVGRFHPIKNHEKLFEVFAKILEKEPKARLLTVGGGSGEDEARINALIEKHGVADKTICLGVRDDVSAIMSTFDVFVFPSILEGFSLVMVEAQALGIRVIASNTVPSEVICENCLALPLSESSERWAEEAFVDHDAKGSVEQFDMPRIIERLEEIYKRSL